MLASRTALVDAAVRSRWAQMPPGIALLAVGGYGRGELFPFSDIDLLILTPKEDTQAAIKEPLSLLLRDLWDSGMRVSQSVRVPRECNQIDPGNSELAVSLLDRRFLAGDEELYRQVRDPAAELGRNIAELTRQRHAGFQDTIYHLEPNVKEAPGGLRDLQVLRWLAKLGAPDEQTPGSVEVLFRIRCFLHYLAGRDDNKLSFERQDEIARLSAGQRPEQLMRDYYRAVTGIARLAARRLENFEARRSGLFARFRDQTSRYSNTDFSVIHGSVLFRSPRALESDPSLAIRLFEHVGRHGLPLAPDTEDRLERAAGFSRWAAEQANLWTTLRAILHQPHAAKALRAMHNCGALEAIFPELNEIEALVIRDFYHRYTVDEHTLVAIQIVVELRGAQDSSFAELARETEQFDLLLAALLFHDVGKAEPGQGHADISRRIADAALARIGAGERERETVSFLIAAHLEMSSMMSGRDLSDPATIRDMAAKAGTVERLKLLTLLTFGDISAVNPAAMTPWRRQLLWNLYTETYNELTRELGRRVSRQDVTSGPAPSDPALAAFLEGLPPRYLRIHNAQEVDEHFRLALESDTKGLAVALTHGAAWLLTVVAEDRPFLFASIAGTLSSFGFNILKAEAFSNARGKVIDTFTFADPLRSLELNPGEADQVRRAVGKVLRGETTVEKLLERRPRSKPDAHALASASVAFDNQASPSATLVQLVTQDRPGLLYDVASLISKRGGNIEVVVVDTEAKKAIDVFYVTQNGAKLNDAEANDLVDALASVARP
jgi:[protein-PII] uridylyltransferase